MIIFPAIDMYEGKVVRLLKGDYNKMTVYSENVVEKAVEIEAAGAKWLHLVDLEGAKEGSTPNFSYVEEICKKTGLKVEIGGGIRSSETIEQYISVGVDRIILGTKAATDGAFLKEMADKFGDKIAVGIDVKDEKVAIKGWLEVLDKNIFDFVGELREIGIKNIIVTDIAKDGAMSGINTAFYEKLIAYTDMNITASGGVTRLDDLVELKKAGLYGAILGKAMYTGIIDLREALKV
jgi:1-(5-phosphoribosyl)-5-[(5-phosphoribosylamino)methylideneamino]imidazole-4-carboxamide isomerase